MRQQMFEKEIHVLRDTFRRLMRRHAHTNLAKLIDRTHPADLAVLFRYFDNSEQENLFALMQANENTGQFLTELDESILEELLDEIKTDRIAELIEPISASDQADILNHLPEEQAQEIIDRFQAEEAEELEEILAYSDDSAGSMMYTDVFLSLIHI